MKHYFLINPAAGKSEDKEALCQAIYRAGEQMGADIEIYKTRCEKDATAFVERPCRENPAQTLRFYACGGDGTFGEVVSGAVGYPNAEVGVMPNGTGNDFVRNFCHGEAFLNPAAQLEGEAVEMDVLKCNDYYSVNMINIGFDCEVVRKTAKLKRHPLIPKKLAYIAGLVITLIRKPGVCTEISTDGGTPEKRRFLLTTFANGSFCGGGFYSNPRASLSDGRIDSLLIQNISRCRFLTLVGSYKKGTHIVPKNEKILSHHKFRTVDMTFDAPQGISVDGELAEVTSLHISCLAQAIRVVVPKGASLKQKKAAEAAYV